MTASRLKMENDTHFMRLSSESKVWMQIPGETYLASDQGLIKNSITRRILYPTLTTDGREKVWIKRDSEWICCKVHRLVAAAWLGPIDGMQINHIDGNPRTTRYLI